MDNTMKKWFSCLSCTLVLLIAGCKEDEPAIVPVPQQPTYKLTDFTPSQQCQSCHPQYYEEWSGSMHRYSTSDPIWRLANNSLQAHSNGALGKACFQCHSPIGFLTDTYKPSFEFSDLDPLVREGINCDLCHILRPPFKTTNQQVEYTLEPGNIKYGTLENPVANSAHENGFEPAYDRSEACRQCHDLILNGVPFEITFTEWQNSPWGAMSVECQKCHMQTYTGRAAVGGPIRTNLHRHTFAGADVAITDFPYRAEQKAEVDSFMKNSAALKLDVATQANLSDSVSVNVTICNDKTGHNLPTSVFFNRQMWIEVTVWKGTDTAYRSGHLDANGDLMDKNSALRPNEDKDLELFNGSLYKNGVETGILIELDSVYNKTIPPFGSHKATYKFKALSTGVWNVKSRLLFRPFGPHLFRALGTGDLSSELPIFEMNVDEKIIQIQ